MNDKKINILVLDGGSNQALATVRSLGNYYNVFTCSKTRFSICKSSKYSKGFLQIDSETLIEYQKILTYSIEHNIKVVLPMTERSCVLLNLLRGEFESNDIIIGASNQKLLDVAFDKFQTYFFCSENLIKTPKTALLSQINNFDEFQFPCVVKPRRSNRIKDNKFLPTETPKYFNSNVELKNFIKTIDQNEYIIQNFTSGSGRGIFALANNGDCIALFSHKRLREMNPTGSGSSLRKAQLLSKEEEQLTKEIVRKLNWSGPIMLEFKQNGSELILLEINGRFWGSLQLAIDSGINFPRIYMDLLLGNTLNYQYDYRIKVLRCFWWDVIRFFYILKGKPIGFKGEFPSVLDGIIELIWKQPKKTKLEFFRLNDFMPFFIYPFQRFEEALK